jgi:protein-S-isoprenylcysteine O-methyltransferase Ste14
MGNCGEPEPIQIELTPEDIKQILIQASPPTLTSDELDVTQASITQVLTLATGVLALSLTFSGQFTKSVPPSQRWPLYASWACFSFTVLFSVWCFLAVTGVKHRGEVPDGTPNRLSGHAAQCSGGWGVRAPWLLQLGSFVLGFAFIVAFAVAHLPS